MSDLLCPFKSEKNSGAQHAKTLMPFQDKGKINYACEIWTWIFASKLCILWASTSIEQLRLIKKFKKIKINKNKN